MSRQINSDEINPDKNQPIYRQVAYILGDMISKDYQTGEYLPSEKELALHFGVNRHTIRRAVEDLVNNGFIIRKQGKGSLIINNQINYSFKSGRFTASLDKLRRNSSCELIKIDVLTCNVKIANYLKIKVGSPVVLIETLRHVDDQPISIITHFLNPEYVPDIQLNYKGGSLHQFINDHYQIPLNRESALISAILPNKEDALFLKSSLTQPLLKIKSFNAIENDSTKIVEVSISRSRADRFQIEID